MIAHKDEIAQPGENIPLSILTYTIRRILRPELLPEQIPEMLDLLWHVDACRRRAVENAKKILIFQEFYRKGKTAGQDVELLRPVEEKEIASLADSDGSKKMREAYCECTFLCCRYVSRSANVRVIGLFREAHILFVHRVGITFAARTSMRVLSWSKSSAQTIQRFISL